MNKNVCEFFISTLAFIFATGILGTLISSNDDNDEKCQCAWVTGMIIYGITVAFLYK